MAFAYKASITIDHTKVPYTDQVDFPVLISGTYDGTGTEPDLRSAANGGNVQSATGYDIYFYSDSALTTRIPAERESYNASTGVIVWWVKKTVLTASDVVIYIAYGDSGISSDPNSDETYGATSVWDSNYKAVWHLPNGTTLTANDSTSNLNNGAITTVAAANGKIDGGAQFDGANGHRIDSGNSSSLDMTSAITISTWTNVIAHTSAQNIVNKGIGGGTGYKFGINTTGFIFTKYGVADVVLGTDATTGFLFLTLTFDTTNGTILYINGVLNATDSATTAIKSNGTTNRFFISGRNDGLGLMLLNTTVVDELRVSNTTRSADWISTEYNNQSSPGTFYAMGSETSAAGSTSPSISPSVSPSQSPSISPSASISPSKSPSLSPSVSPSASVSPSISPSISPSVSPSLSSSISSSVSSSKSPSLSFSLSPSFSPSPSPSLSPSVSPSPSISPSVSPSPSPGWENYTRGDYVTLPGVGIADLENAYSDQDYIDVATKNDVRVGQTATNQYTIHQFKDYVGDIGSCILEWEGQTNCPPSLSAVYLQIFNSNNPSWDTIDSDNSSPEDTDFILTASIPDLTNYKVAGSYIVCRVWQLDV